METVGHSGRVHELENNILDESLPLDWMLQPHVIT